MLAAALLVAATEGLCAQDGKVFDVSYHLGEKQRITERSNLRRYQDDRFIGLASREVRGLVEVVDTCRPAGPNSSSDDAFDHACMSLSKDCHTLFELDHAVDDFAGPGEQWEFSIAFDEQDCCS